MKTTSNTIRFLTNAHQRFWLIFSTLFINIQTMYKLLLMLTIFITISNMAYCNNEKQYNGIATTEIEYYEYNPYTDLYDFIEKKIYVYEIYVFITDPLISSNFTTETNPFHISIYPKRNNSISEEGHIDISSSLLITSSLGGNVLLQYWVIDSNGNNVTGTLTNTHSAEAAAVNMIWAWKDIVGFKMTMPYSMANNAKLNGEINQDNISLEIEGESVCTSRKFKTVLTANNIDLINGLQNTFLSNCKMYQNIPNPFSSSTVIPFELYKTGNVQFSVYNLKGEKCIELLRKKMEAGRHYFVWDVNKYHISPGIYLIRMQTDDCYQYQKCILLE